MYPSVESIYDTLQSINNSKYSLKEMERRQEGIMRLALQ